uniref:Protein ORF6A n=1 Tax=Anguillid herpesvirus 1 TaxID=150286 RepID=A0A8E5AN74_9VIRU|nr:protein ORF6A [Anguillid herpesvirus 1]QRM16950.1 protein ORF6A [Anguillid herpesvirus 1]
MAQSRPSPFTTIFTRPEEWNCKQVTINDGNRGGPTLPTTFVKLAVPRFAQELEFEKRRLRAASDAASRELTVRVPIGTPSPNFPTDRQKIRCHMEALFWSTVLENMPSDEACQAIQTDDSLFEQKAAQLMGMAKEAVRPLDRQYFNGDYTGRCTAPVLELMMVTIRRLLCLQMIKHNPEANKPVSRSITPPPMAPMRVYPVPIAPKPVTVSSSSSSSSSPSPHIHTTYPTQSAYNSNTSNNFVLEVGRHSGLPSTVPTMKRVVDYTAQALPKKRLMLAGDGLDFTTRLPTTTLLSTIPRHTRNTPLPPPGPISFIAEPTLCVPTSLPPSSPSPSPPVTPLGRLSPLFISLSAAGSPTPPTTPSTPLLGPVVHSASRPGRTTAVNPSKAAPYMPKMASGDLSLHLYSDITPPTPPTPPSPPTPPFASSSSSSASSSTSSPSSPASPASPASSSSSPASSAE